MCPTTLDVCIENVCLQALLDSGSKFNIIEGNRLRRHDHMGSKARVPQLKSASGDKLDVLGTQRVPVVVNSRTVIVEFVVVSQLSVGVILGRQLMRICG